LLGTRVRTVLVLGASRSGIGAARVLASLGREVVLSDSKEVVLPADIPAELRRRVRVSTSPQDGAQLEGIDLVVKSPGVPGEAAPVSVARSRGIPVWGEVELAYRLLSNPITAVTGTNGKTTTTALIGHIMKEAGRPVKVVGNIGTALTAVVLELTGQEELVVEMSSFQLEDTVSFRPRVSVLLNVTPDHLDRHGDMARYLECKAMLFANQGAEDTAVLNAADPVVRGVGVDLLGRSSGPNIRFFSTEEQDLPCPQSSAHRLSSYRAEPQRCMSASDGPQTGSGAKPALHSWLSGGWLHLDGARALPASALSLRGMHNVENCLAAAVAALARGVGVNDVVTGLRTFPGVPHRLEKAGKIAGVEYVNDSKATNVDAALKALEAYAHGVHLIVGGRDKGSDYLPLARVCVGACVAVYLVGEATPLIAEAFERLADEAPRADLPPVSRVGDLEAALYRASEVAVSGETVLLAPACASFDQYEDFEARGRHFTTIVERLRREIEGDRWNGKTTA
jgi:UDP-N-acetylmuramoylalanine--D-glutamate ligase